MKSDNRHGWVAELSRLMLSGYDSHRVDRASATSGGVEVVGDSTARLGEPRASRSHSEYATVSPGTSRASDSTAGRGNGPSPAVDEAAWTKSSAPLRSRRLRRSTSERYERRRPDSRARAGPGSETTNRVTTRATRPCTLNDRTREGEGVLDMKRARFAFFALLAAGAFALAGATTGSAGGHASGQPDTYVASWDGVGAQALTAAGLSPAEGHV